MGNASIVNLVYPAVIDYSTIAVLPELNGVAAPSITVRMCTANITKFTVLNGYVFRVYEVNTMNSAILNAKVVTYNEKPGDLEVAPNFWIIF